MFVHTRQTSNQGVQLNTPGESMQAGTDTFAGRITDLVLQGRLPCQVAAFLQS